MGWSERNRLPVTFPYNIMSQKVPSGVTGLPDFRHTGEEKQVTVKCQTHLSQKQKVMVDVSAIA